MDTAQCPAAGLSAASALVSSSLRIAQDSPVLSNWRAIKSAKCHSGGSCPHHTPPCFSSPRC